MLHNLISLQLKSRATQLRAFSSSPGIEWLNQFINYEQKGVPQSAGTNTAEGFDMVCFENHRLFHRYFIIHQHLLLKREYC